MNLLPQKNEGPQSYYCTWKTQNFGKNENTVHSDAAAFEGDQGAKTARNYLNEETVFSQNGMIHQFHKIRKNLYFILDDGWDVPYNVHPDTKKYMFGSLELNEVRFPSCKGTPPQRLSAMNEMVKKEGWRGVGLWIAAQAAGEGKNSGLFSRAGLEKYWRERARWSAEAGIEYWKVDWGLHERDMEFRRMLTEIAKEEAPLLTVEHCRCCGPFNDDTFSPWEKGSGEKQGRYKNWGSVLADAVETLSFSDVLRSYDVSAHLSTASTLDRLTSIFQKAVLCGAKGIINCEDEMYIGASLGCNLGIMRSNLCRSISSLDYDPGNTDRKIDEAVRAVRWQQIAPAFEAGKAPVYASDSLLTDSWYFKPGDTWASWVIGKEIKQSCPAVVSRGIENIKVQCEGEPPFIAASKNPNGAVSIAALPRISADKGIYLNAADVEINVDSPDSIIGIFGKFNKLTINFNCDIEKKMIWMQDLAGDEAENITEAAEVGQKSVCISGGIIEKIGRMASSPFDPSDPGVVLRLLD